MGDTLIEIDRVCKSFDGGRSFAARDVSLAIEAGAFLALVGASGAGKTTTPEGHQPPDRADSGEVRIGGKPVTAVDAPTLRRSIGYVFQGIGLFPHMSVGENIAITPQLLGWPAAEIDARVRELLDLVELPQGYATRYPATLSGGQQQRVGVARAIAARPKIVLMDEPFGALDPLTRDAIAAGLSRAARPPRPHHHHGDPRHAGGGAARRPYRGHERRPRAGGRYAARPHGGARAGRGGGADGHAEAPRRAHRCHAQARTTRRAVRMNDRIANALQLLPDYLARHVLLCVVALVLGVLLACPWRCWRRVSARIRVVALAAASVVQTIPGLALLALFYPLLLGVSMVTNRLFGFSLPALGFLPSLLALTLYSMLPILRNGVAGLTGLDPAVIEAANARRHDATPTTAGRSRRRWRRRS